MCLQELYPLLQYVSRLAKFAATQAQSSLLVCPNKLVFYWLCW
jgi:hypothetical protein